MSSANPFSGYEFLVKWDGEYVAAVTRVSGLTRPAQPPAPGRTIPGQADSAPVRLERGIITDAAFERWAEMDWSWPNTSALGQETSVADFRKPMQIELYDEAGQIVLRYNLNNCWASEYTAMPELDADSNEVALESMTIQHEGWERDPSVAPPPPSD
jgi:phage tail-like protein